MDPTTAALEKEHEAVIIFSWKSVKEKFSLKSWIYSPISHTFDYLLEHVFTDHKSQIHWQNTDW